MLLQRHTWFMPHKRKLAALNRFLGKKIRSIRLQKGYSQEDLAFKLGVSQGYVSLLERGKKNMTILRLDDVAKVLDIPLEELVK